MKLYDRLSGDRLDRLPPVIHPGRYVLRQSARFNRHSQLDEGAVLSSDGTERCELDQETARFSEPDPALDDDTDFLTRVLDNIANLDSKVLPSPLLPTAVIDEDSHLNDLERALGDVLKAGHLHMISKRPRIDLRYEETVTEVSRARRLTNKTYTHLASHSECWQRQTLQGIQPKRVLARLSEDEYAIYENIVYARLVDKLERYLTGRVRRLDSLCEQLEKALAFSSSTDLNHRLFDEICVLWGSTYQAGSAERLKATREARETVAKHLKSLRSLQQTGLYLQVARDRQAGPVLHRSNILMHDQHYRHLGILWDALRQTVQSDRLSPAQRLHITQKRETDYSHYVGLVLRHALQRYGLGSDGETVWAGHVVRLHRDQFNWHLLVDGAVKLGLVPWAYPDALPAGVMVPERFWLCWPGTELNDTLDQALIGQALRLSPMDLYVVERMGYLVDRVLTSMLLEDYAVPLKPLPKMVAEGAGNVQGIMVQASQLQLIGPLSSADTVNMQTLFDQHTRPELAQTFRRQAQHLQALRQCPVCNGVSTITPQDNGGFSGQCQRAGCGAKRYWRRAKVGQWIYRQLFGDAPDFRVYGRRSMEFSIPHR